MELNRREFLKASGTGVGGIFLLGALNPNVALAKTKRLPLRKRIGEKSTICPYDASGCGFIVAAQNGKVLNIEGDPDHPINRGAACAKGASMRQLSADNPWRPEQTPLPASRWSRLGTCGVGLGIGYDCPQDEGHQRRCFH